MHGIITLMIILLTLYHFIFARKSTQFRVDIFSCSHAKGVGMILDLYVHAGSDHFSFVFDASLAIVHHK